MKGNNQFTHLWNEEEDDIIKTHYLKGDEYLQSLLPNRTISSIKQHRLKVLELKNNHYSRKNKIWREEKENIITDYVENELSLTDISKKWNINNETLRENMVREGVHTSVPRQGREFIYNKNWLKFKENIIEDYLNGISTEKLENIYGLDGYVIRENLKYEGVFERYLVSGKSVDFNFFRQINSKVNSYWLGMMYSDGNVNITKDGSKNINLSITDENVVEDFRKIIKFEGVITKVKNENKKDNYQLRIINHRLFDDLVKLGCVPKKSLILTFPNKKQLPSEYITPFLYGYFDGDGHIGIYQSSKNSKSKRFTFEVVGTKNFINQYKKELLNRLEPTDREFFDKSMNVKQRFHKNPLTHLTITNTYILLSVCDLLFHSYPSKMERKKKIFLEILKWIYENPTYERNNHIFNRYGDTQDKVMKIVNKYR